MWVLLIFFVLGASLAGGTARAVFAGILAVIVGYIAMAVSIPFVLLFWVCYTTPHCMTKSFGWNGQQSETGYSGVLKETVGCLSGTLHGEASIPATARLVAACLGGRLQFFAGTPRTMVSVNHQLSLDSD
jgi:hypothetical protein